MRPIPYHILLLLAAGIFPVLTMSAALPRQIITEPNCDESDPKWDCAGYFDPALKDCSPAYVAAAERCIVSGCIQWLIDPLQHCYDTTPEN
ncbi:hypothetical protein RUND412_003381 [Rhizina undulata]